jgi:hypothetical protein
MKEKIVEIACYLTWGMQTDFWFLIGSETEQTQFEMQSAIKSLKVIPNAIRHSPIANLRP